MEGSHQRGSRRAESQLGRRAFVSGALVVAAMILVAWIRMLPLSLAGVEPSEQAQLTYLGEDGRQHVYLGDFDSYYWLRAARRYLQSGSICDAVVDGRCRDDHTRAPFGGIAKYEHSAHVASIVWVQRLMTWVTPGYPLSASAFLVPVIVGTLGVLPAFAIGRRLAGNVGGLCAAVSIAVNPLFLIRSIGSDNDVWNVVLPLCLMWAAIRTVEAESVARQATYGLVGVLVAGLHALTWNGWIFTYLVVLIGLLAHVLLTLLRTIVHDGGSVWRSRTIRRAALAFAYFSLVPLVVLRLPGADAETLIDALHLTRDVYRVPTAVYGPAVTEQWPDPFASVGELARPALKRIATLVAGVAYFFVGWLGLLVLLLPRRRWDWRHFAILIGGNYLYAYLVTRPHPGRLLLIGWLALPLAVAMLLSVLDADRRAATERGAALLVVTWFLCALFLAFEAVRFTMLMIPPFGIVFGVAMGRLYEWLTEVAARLPVPQRLSRGFLFVLVCGVLYLPVRGAYGLTRTYIPRVNDAWWDTLTQIREKTSPATILSTWWPYGYWVEYAGDRQTSVDGGALPTHVPYWMARVLFAPTEEGALGLLRMLDCGSDFHPIERDEAGAYDRLIWQGVDGITAQTMVDDLARRNRTEAQAYLRARGIDGPAAERILAVTHCQPPPALLIVSDDMLDKPGWKYLGNWSFQRAYVARRLRERPAAEAVREITERFGISEAEGRALYRAARDLDTEAARAAFVSPRQSYFTKAWVPCRPGAGGQELVCPLNVQLPSRGAVIDAFAYRRDTPSAGRVRWRPAVDTVPREGDAAEVLIAGAADMERVTFTDAIDSRLGILMDVPNDRILVGTPALLRSTFTHLMFLDGRYARHLRKFDERVGYQGERVVTWIVDWGSDETRSNDGR